MRLKERRERPSFFEKKEAKKLLVLGALDGLCRLGYRALPLIGSDRAKPPGPQVFWCFFSKKNVFLFTFLGVEALSCGAAGAAALPARQAGMWLSSTVATLPDGTKYQGGQPVVTVTCVDATDDQKFFLSGGSACSTLAVSGSGASYRIDGTCQHAGKPVTVHETLNYVDARTVELAGTVDAGNGPITLTAELKYAGECVPGMQPGDEGSLDANGNFDKTDNINDFQNQ